jgi:PKD repeat protein
MVVNDFSAYIHDDDTSVLAVAIIGAGDFTLEQLQLTMLDPPHADLVAQPAYGLAPLPVQFSAADSFDVDGTIELYEWDFDGDGIYDEAGVYASALHVFDEVGIPSSACASRMTTADRGRRRHISTVLLKVGD